MVQSRIMYTAAAVLWLSFWIGRTAASGGIPGTTQTDSGYDTEMGTDAICWKSQSAKQGLAMSSPLIQDFNVSLDGVKLLKACPAGNNISGTAPEEHVVYDQRLRTGREYIYRVSLDINMTSLSAAAGFTSDQGPGWISVQILDCVAGIAGFCSPFIHEEATARLAALKAAQSAATKSDAAASSSSTSPATSTTAKAPRIKGGLHGGSHVHSGFVDVYLDPAHGPVYQDVKVDIPMTVAIPGNYFSIATVQLYFYDANASNSISNVSSGNDVFDAPDEPILWRYDMSNALMGKQRLISYQTPAVILEVDPGAKYFVFVLIVISSTGILYLLVETIRHRNHQVMKLSQATFLILFLVAAWIATVSSFLMEPKNDIYCRIDTPISITALQVLYAVTVGRLWRIHTLINPLLLKTMGHETSCWTRLTEFVQSKVIRRGNSRKMRYQVTEGHLAALVAVLTMPQVLVQILGVILQPRSRAVDYNSDESIGRAVCKSGSDDLNIGQTIIYYGYFLFCLLVAGLLAMAIQSRKLPSLFNESKTIFDSALTSFCIMVMGVAIITVTQDPTTSPTVAYLVWVFIILSISVNTSLRIVLPKLRMVWRGETVIVSQLVMDHTQKIRKHMNSGASNEGTTNSLADYHTRGVLYDQDSLFRSSNDVKATTGISSKSETLDQTSTAEQPIIIRGHSETDVDSSESPARKPKKTVSLVAPADKTDGSSSSVGKPKKKGTVAFEEDGNKKKAIVLIEADKAPSRRLLLKMVDFQEHLNRVTQKIMTGVAVPCSEWEQTRRLARKFGTTFTDNVQFAWDQAEEGEQPSTDVLYTTPSTDVLYMDMEEGEAGVPLHGDVNELAPPLEMHQVGPLDAYQVIPEISRQGEDASQIVPRESSSREEYDRIRQIESGTFVDI